MTALFRSTLSAHRMLVLSKIMVDRLKQSHSFRTVQPSTSSRLNSVKAPLTSAVCRDQTAMYLPVTSEPMSPQALPLPRPRPKPTPLLKLSRTHHRLLIPHITSLRYLLIHYRITAKETTGK